MKLYVRSLKLYVGINVKGYTTMPVSPPCVKLGQDCYIVHDANGHALTCIYFEDETGRRSATI